MSARVGPANPRVGKLAHVKDTTFNLRTQWEAPWNRLLTNPGSPREGESIESFKERSQTKSSPITEGEVGREPDGQPTAPEAGVV
jgi:hypothetical protein